jgi:hypothetical protein
MRRLASLLVATIALAVALGACQATGGGIVPGTGPLVTVQMRGGMCADGGVCESSVILERDGRVHAAAKPPNDLGVVDAATMATLTNLVQQTDYATLKSKPFTGECPTNFDGQELIFEFAAPGGNQVIAQCQVDIDWGHPLFVAVGTALGAWIPLPLT